MDLSVSTPTFWLSFHTPYACRDSGACCSSGWAIDIDAARVPAIAAAVADGRIAAPVQWWRADDGAPHDVAGVLRQGSDGHCIFHQRPGCAVQSALGHGALPSACQHFPRSVLIDPRGVFVTLSHYCPTAAALLFEAHDRAAIVSGPPALPGGGRPEGLDARDALPPLAAPGRLMDWDEFSAWERRAVELLCSEPCVGRALDRIDPRDDAVDDATLVDLARSAVPAPYSWPAPFAATAGTAIDRAVLGRYLAAHAFGAWTAYVGDGLRATVLYLRVVLAVVRSELARGRTPIDAIRQSDLLLRHLVDRNELGRLLTLR